MEETNRLAARMTTEERKESRMGLILWTDAYYEFHGRDDIRKLLDELDAVEAERDESRRLCDAHQHNLFLQTMGFQADLKKAVAERDAAIKERDALRKQLAHYKWRPIADIHEDYGPCVLMCIDDPGYLQVGSNLDDDFSEMEWTHFVEVPKLTTEEADDLAAAMEQPNGN